MRVALDTNALFYLLDNRTPRELQDRLNGLLEEIGRAKGKVVIPTPVLSEYLVNAGQARTALLDAFVKDRYVEVAPFDHVAAEECAALHRTAFATGDKRYPLRRATAWQKVKVDRQIVAIAKVRGTRIVADDDDVRAIATAANFPVQKVASLPLPEWAKQLYIVDVPPVQLSAREHLGGGRPATAADESAR